MFKRAAVFYLVLCGWALPASPQSIYTTAVAITPDHGLFPGGFDLYDYFEPGAPIQGTGYHIYTIDSSLKLVGQGVTLGPVGARFAVVNDGDVLDQSHFRRTSSFAEWVSTDS